MRPAKIVAIIVGAILLLIGLGLIAPGGFLLWAYGTQRDSSGFFEASGRTLSSNGYALTAPEIDINIGTGLGWTPIGSSTAVRLRAQSTKDIPVFIGIGPSADVSRYLQGVAQDEVTNFGWRSDSAEYQHVDGGPPAGPPGQQTFWAASRQGTGEQVLDWNIRDGTWTAVVMNADGSQQVIADVGLGARFDILLPIGIGLTIGGVVLLAVGVLLIALGARRPRWPSQTYPQQAPPGPYGYPTDHPADYPPDWPARYPGERPIGYPRPWTDESTPAAPPTRLAPTPAPPWPTAPGSGVEAPGVEPGDTEEPGDTRHGHG